MARRPKLPRKDALLVFLVLLVAGLLMDRFGGDDTILRWLGAASTVQQEEYVPTLGAETLSAEVAHTAPLQKQVDIAAIPKPGKPVRFLMHNVQNYFVEGEAYRSRYVLKPKSKEARDAVVEVITSAQPAIVGLVEIGGPLALQDLRAALPIRGWSIPISACLPGRGRTERWRCFPCTPSCRTIRRRM